MSQNNIFKELINKSYKNRLTLLKIIKRCGAAHLGGAFSAMDILTVLYNNVLKHNPKNPKWDNRDIFILSAGHKAIVLYVILESQGYFKRDILWTYNKLDTKLPIHPDEKILPGVEFPTGSLGHGLSVASGIAISFKRDNLKRKVFVLLGDGEISEGSIWEAILGIAKYKLDNLVAIIDVNNMQADGYTQEILNVAPFEDKFKDFGWSTRTIDGHDIEQIYKAFSDIPYEKEKPSCIIANTVKAKGVDFAENKPEFHYWSPRSSEEVDRAINCLKKSYKKD